MRSIICGLLLLFCCAACLFAQEEISGLKLDNKQSVLNGRAFLNFPAEAKNIARQTDIMSADPNADKETRIMFDIGQQRLVFFARELYVTSDANLMAHLSKNHNEAADFKVLTRTDSLVSVLVSPKKYDSAEAAILINDLYVKTADNSVFVISAFINPEAYKNKANFQSLSERIFTSITPGARRLNFTARTEELPVFEGTKKFSIALPEGFVVTKDKKYDFEVLKFQKMRPITDTGWLSLTIYTGHHPSYFYKDYNFDIDDVVKSTGLFLGKKVEWLNFKNTAEPVYLREQQIPSGQIEDGLIVHIAMLSADPRDIDELSRIIEKIKLVQ